MSNNSNIKLHYFKTFLQEYQWFLLYEFKGLDDDLFLKSDEEVLKSLISGKILGNTLSHSEITNSQTEVVVENIHRPYKFDRLHFSDFQFKQTKEEFKKWLISFSNEFEDDRGDAEILINKAKREIFSRTNLKNGVWHLSKEYFKDDSDKLIELHWIYFHFETFLEIDRQNHLIRTFDFGYD